jgi:hypothetical protein
MSILSKGGMPYRHVQPIGEGDDVGDLPSGQARRQLPVRDFSARQRQSQLHHRRRTLQAAGVSVCCSVGNFFLFAPKMEQIY